MPAGKEGRKGTELERGDGTVEGIEGRREVKRRCENRGQETRSCENEMREREREKNIKMKRWNGD